MRLFKQVDVFSSTPYKGNPVAVIVDAEGLSSEEMACIANWTNLSETTFVLPPTAPGADYRVRIFTPNSELPFAGHPTLGTAHAWLESGGKPATDGVVVQQCEAGLIQIRHLDGRLAFAAPPLVRSGPIDHDELERVCQVLKVNAADVVAAEWVDNGPGWIGVLLSDSRSVLDLVPDFGAADQYDIGVVGPKVGAVGSLNGGAGVVYPDPAIELRAFFRSGGQAVEDPVTGSLNASVAQWLLGAGHLEAPYVASQGTVLGRQGKVYIDLADDGTIWVGGHTVTCISGEMMI